MTRIDKKLSDRKHKMCCSTFDIKQIFSSQVVRSETQICKIFLEAFTKLKMCSFVAFDMVFSDVCQTHSSCLISNSRKKLQRDELHGGSTKSFIVSQGTQQNKAK